MNTDLQIKTIEQKVIALISSDPDSFLVEVKIKPGNNVKVFVDADHGVSIDKLATLNRNLYKQIDEERIFQNNDFSLEISSPGLDEPLKLQRQYVKNIGRYIEVILKNGIKKEGKLISAADDEFVIEEEKGNKKVKEFVQSPIFYNEVKTTKIQIKF
ncbi:MAG TPA: ribosome maturation factor [Chitinophagaceae bacterium]|jgi:ribosome maturation factor RimP